MTRKRELLGSASSLRPAVPGFRKLEGYRVTTDPGGKTIELLIKGFANEGELESFVLKLREMGLLRFEVNGVPGEFTDPDEA